MLSARRKRRDMRLAKLIEKRKKMESQRTKYPQTPITFFSLAPTNSPEPQALSPSPSLLK